MTPRLFDCATGKMEFPASKLEKTPGQTDMEKIEFNFGQMPDRHQYGEVRYVSGVYKPRAHSEDVNLGVIQMERTGIHETRSNYQESEHR